MKYIIYMLLYFSLVGVCAANDTGNESTNKEQSNNLLDANISPNIRKEQEQNILKIYNDRLDLLSIKERQLVVYEKSLKNMKATLLELEKNTTSRENRLDEQELMLFKKELELKEKQRKLEQLEEKLALIDNNQLIRDSYLQKVALESLKIDTNFSGGIVSTTGSNISNVSGKVDLSLNNVVVDENKSAVRSDRKSRRKTDYKRKSELNSGLDGMRKEVAQLEPLIDK